MNKKTIISISYKTKTMQNNERWKDIGVREKMQIINGTTLVFSAIILYFVAFIVTLTIGFEVISAGATLLGSGLAFFGITAFVKNQMVQFEATVDRKIKDIEESDRKKKIEEDNNGES